MVGKQELDGERSIIFMRHGKQVIDLSRGVYEEYLRQLNDPHIPLSPEGRNEVERAVGYLPSDITLILTSPYTRTTETAEIIKSKLVSRRDLIISIKEEPLLKEVEYKPSLLSPEEVDIHYREGGLMQLSKAGFNRWRIGEGNVGEDPSDLSERMKNLINIFSDTLEKNKRVLTVSHAAIGRALKRTLAGVPLTAEWDLPIETCSYFSINQCELHRYHGEQNAISK